MDLSARKYRDAVKTLGSLESAGYAARLAGGCVRDRLLGKEPKDFDVATTAKPEDVMRHFRAVGLRTVPTGVDHGTVTLVLPSGPVEITTLRRDVATDGRHAKVEFGESFEDDAARRDFTINAMFEDSAGTVYDYFGGRDDLAGGVLRFVGDAATRIREDYLRILRLFRFWANLGFPPAEGVLAAVAAEAKGLAQISQERITGEIIRLLAAPGARAALAAMAGTGVLALVLPELGELAKTDELLPHGETFTRWRAAAQPHRAIAVLGGLLLRARLAEPAVRAVGERLRLSTADVRRLALFPALVAALTQPPFSGATATATDADWLELADAADAAGGDDALAALYAPVLATEPDVASAAATLAVTDARLGHRRKARLPLGGDAVARHLGLAPGPELGAALAALRRAYRNGLWQTADEGLAWLSSSAKSAREPD